VAWEVNPMVPLAVSSQNLGANKKSMSNGQFVQKDHAWTESNIGTVPDPSRKRPRRHVKGTRVSACANRSLAFSYVPSG
jgi:hypothetical protein